MAPSWLRNFFGRTRQNSAFPIKMTVGRYHDHEPEEEEDADTPLKLTAGLVPPPSRELRELKRKKWCVEMSLAITAMALLSVTIYAVLVRVQLNQLLRKSHKWSGRLGEDPSEFVPQGVGEPLQLTYYDEDHPYFFPEDIFDNLDTSLALISKVRSMHNSSNVLVNQRYAKWFHKDGTVTHLAPFFSWGSTRQVYTLRGFHQLSCVLALAEEYAHRVHTNATSRWSTRHVAHCLNALRDAVMCMADAAPVSFVGGFQTGYVTDDQAYVCRSWEALRAWANDPRRGVRTRVAAGDEPPGGQLKPGALYDFEFPDEILPFPELTEKERAGLA